MEFRTVFPYLAKMEIAANADFDFRVKLPWQPCEVAEIIITSSQNITIGGSLFNKLLVTDKIGGGEEKVEVDIDGSLTLGGVSGTRFKFMSDVQVNGQNLAGSTCKLLIQFLILSKDGV